MHITSHEQLLALLLRNGWLLTREINMFINFAVFRAVNWRSCPEILRSPPQPPPFFCYYNPGARVDCRRALTAEAGGLRVEGLIKTLIFAFTASSYAPKNKRSSLGANNSAGSAVESKQKTMWRWRPWRRQRMLIETSRRAFLIVAFKCAKYFRPRK